MNGHCRARMKLILRQCENLLKIYSSRGFPASNYRLKWSNIAGQGSNIKMSKKSIFSIFFGNLYRSRGSRGPSGRVQNRSQSLKTITHTDFYVDPWSPVGHLGVSRTDSRAEKHQKNHIFLSFPKK